MTDEYPADTVPIPEDLRARLSAKFPLSGLPNMGQPTERANAVRGYGGLGVQPPPTQRATRRHPFEVYITGWTDANHTTANVYVSRGTILNDEQDIEDVVAITGIDTAFTLTADDWLYIEVTFDSAGEITGAELKKAGVAGWTGYPELSTSTTKWMQPICNVRAMKTGKAGGGVPDSGEWSQIETDKFIAQKTNTHLVKVQACVGGLLRWKLMPGAGGKD